VKESTNKDRLTRLRAAWTTEIQAEDYEHHMAKVGQAQANAQLVADWLHHNRPKLNASILFAGAGTGQMLDLLPPEILIPYRVTFTDINREFLKRLESRLKNPRAGLRFRILVDDVERSNLSTDFALAVAVLVLEHVDWRRAVASLCGLSTSKVFVVIQENPPDSHASVSDNQPLTGTMKIFRETQPSLLSQRELIQEFHRQRFALIYSREKEVLYGKKMVGLGFRKKTQARSRLSSTASD